jgi:Carboxypeptidase regulatory-like domain
MTNIRRHTWTRRLRISPAFLFCCLLASPAFAASSLSGSVLDPNGSVVPGATIRLSGLADSSGNSTLSDGQGHFFFGNLSPGEYKLTAELPGFAPVTRNLVLADQPNQTETIHLVAISGQNESVIVTADVNDMNILAPDPGEQVFLTQDLLDPNAGRPGAPVSIPGYPVETASSGIKAPQYFAPGVAGDHGEPIAQYIQVGSYLVPNNLSANAHGNGYSDPNILIGDVIESVQVDAGAYNVREGNHALNLATVYGLRSYLSPFINLTTDYRDATVTAGISPSTDSWAALEGSFGNGLLDRLEHRKQFKFNGERIVQAGDHILRLFGIAYFGSGYVAGLTPIFGFNSVDAAAGWKTYPDTIDPRQKDQTHTALVALNDVWKLSSQQELQLSGFFRTYNLALFSDFGLGLIRQSEFRTVGGANLTYVDKIGKWISLLAGTDYEREAPRDDDLNHFNFFTPAAPSYYGPFVKIQGNNVSIAPLTPFVAGEGDLGSHFRYYLGWRRDEIAINNQDLITPENSWNRRVGLNSPKATFTLLPGAWNAPLISFSFGKSFFTEDPRMGTEFANPIRPDPVETARSFQLVASKVVRGTELRLTLGHATQSAEYGKIDPDQGLQFDLGPGRIRYLAFTLRQTIANGSLEATVEPADARLVNTAYSVVPEAPRFIGDVTGTYRKLPFHLQAKGEFEYVGRKVVGNGCSEEAYLSGDRNALNAYCLGVANKEFRLAVTREFLEGRLNVGVNAMIASGWTGQTTENFAMAAVYGPGKVGLGRNLLVPANPVSEIVGVRIPSYGSVSITYRFGKHSD